MKIGVKSDKGMTREINEDSYNIIAGYSGIPVSLIVADGMGGHNSGEIASKTAVDYISNYILQFPEFPPEEENIAAFIRDIIEKANNEVFTLSRKQEGNYGMGTTLILGIVYNRKLFIGHVGDSRAYLIREGIIKRITTDHSFVEELVKSGSLTRQEAERHPGKNIITRALGCSENVQIDTLTCNIMDNDIFILCTDGLTNMLTEDEIKETAESMDDPEGACNELVYRANKKGGEDNITVILIRTS